MFEQDEMQVYKINEMSEESLVIENQISQDSITP